MVRLLIFYRFTLPPNLILLQIAIVPVGSIVFSSPEIRSARAEHHHRSNRSGDPSCALPPPSPTFSATQIKPPPTISDPERSSVARGPWCLHVDLAEAFTVERQDVCSGRWTHMRSGPATSLRMGSRGGLPRLILLLIFFS